MRCPKCNADSHGVGDSVSITIDIYGYSPCTIDLRAGGAPIVQRQKVFENPEAALSFCLQVLYEKDFGRNGLNAPAQPEKSVTAPAAEEVEVDLDALLGLKGKE